MVSNKDVPIWFRSTGTRDAKVQKNSRLVEKEGLEPLPGVCRNEPSASAKATAVPD
jgi:hypothetical protein